MVYFFIGSMNEQQFNLKTLIFLNDRSIYSIPVYNLLIYFERKKKWVKIY